MGTVTHDRTRPNGSGGNGALAKGLGWFSIGLGLAELAAPDAVARLIGIENDSRNRAILRAFGLREIAAGVGILAQPRQPGWLWARVAGDAMDLGALGTAFATDDVETSRTVAATAAVLGVTALDVMCGVKLTSAKSAAQPGVAPDEGVRLRAAITVNASPEAVYDYWHRFENLPTFMPHLESVRTTGEGRSHWTARLTGGGTLEWDAETTEDRPGELIAWRSLPGAQLPNAGRVRFRRAPGNRGTEVELAMRYDPPGGVIGEAVAKLLHRIPDIQVENDLRAFKQIMETGEVLRSDASVGGAKPRPAFPPDREVPLPPLAEPPEGGYPERVRRRRSADTHFDAGLTTEEGGR